MSNRYESGSLAACSEDEVTITVAVTGALGRMGSLIIENVGDAPDMELVAAFDIHDIGMPVGAGIAAGAGDVRVADAREIDALLASISPDVLIDFTSPDA